MGESRFMAVRWLAYQASRGVSWVAYAMLHVVGRLPAETLRNSSPRLALSFFRVAHALSPRSCFPLRYLAWCLRETGDLSGAIVHYKLLIELWPSFVEGRVELGEALNDRDRHPEALEQFERAHQESPSDTRVQRSLG